MTSPDLSRNPFSRPFPDRKFGRATVMGVLRIGLFVTLALYFLQPLGTAAGGGGFVVALGYGLVTFIVALLYYLMTEKVLGVRRSGPSWTLGRWMLDCAVLLAFISAGNFVFHNFLVGWTAFSPLILAYVGLPTVLIGLFPIAFSGMALQMRAERNHQRAAGRLTSVTRPREPGTGAGERLLVAKDLTIDPATILYAEARGGTVRLVYLVDGRRRDRSVALSIGELADRTAPHGLLRCHPSFLLNPAFVAAARGTAQGLRVRLLGAEEEVPVAMAYVTELERVMLA